MTSDRRPAIPFVTKARRPGGVGMEDAVAAADAALNALAPAMRSRVDALAETLRGGIEAVRRGNPSAVERVRRDADLLAGCAAHAGLKGLGRSAGSLCRLIDAAAPAPPSPAALQPFLDAMGVLAKADLAGAETEAVLDGLERIAARQAARP